jgi:hypothetical protein
MKKLFYFLVGLGIFFFWGGIYWPAWAQEVVINEFSALSSPDWVELYNPGEEIASLDGWVIRDETQSNKIDLAGLICPGSFRKFDFSNRLNNGGDEIRLIDGDGNEIDLVIYFSQVIPTHLIGQSTGRNPDGADSWQVFPLPNPQDEPCFLPTPTLLPTAAVSITPSPVFTPTIFPSPIVSLTPTPNPTPTTTPTPALTPISTPAPIPTSSPQDYDQIFLNEVMANPNEGSEWVELYNGNSFAVNLIDWFLDDLADGGSSPQKFSLEIEPDNYAVFTLDRAVFNNSGDEVRLLNCHGEVKDSFSYSKTIAGQSWGLVDNEWCLQEASPGEANFNCLSDQDVVAPTVTIGLTETADDQGKKMENTLGVSTSDHQEGLVYFDFDLGTYLLASKPVSFQERCETVYSSRGKWLPGWLLFSWGFLSFGIGILRVIRSHLRNFDFANRN